MATLLDEILEATIKFKDDQGNDIAIKGSDLRIYCPKGATYEQINEFKMKVEALGLDPRRGDVYMALFKDKDGREQVTILTNYLVYLRRAWASKKLDTFKVIINKPNENSPDTWTAKFTGKRKDSTQEFETPEIPVSEINKKRNLWNIMPTVMTTVRMATFGLRWMLTDVLGGMPYIAEEIEPENETLNEVSQKQKSGEKAEKLPEPDINKLSQNGNPKITGWKTKIEGFLTIKELSDWAKTTQKSIDKSGFKDEIDVMIESRRKYIIVITLSKVMNIDQQIIADFLDVAKPEETVINEVMTGDVDAITELAKMIENFKARQNEEAPESETEDAELDLGYACGC